MAHKSQTEAGKAPPSRSRQKRLPQRTCVACRQTESKRQLVRVVRTEVGRVAPDPTGKRNGRGAYICLDLACWEVALKRRSLERSLRIEQLHPDDRAELVQFMEEIVATSTTDLGETARERRS